MSTGVESGSFAVSWRGQGRILPGSLSYGSRVLVFEGLVREAFLLDTLDVNITSDGRNSVNIEALELFFEVDN